MGVKKLGRGLDALLGVSGSDEKPQLRPLPAEISSDDEKVAMVKTSDLFPSQFQPREEYDEDALGDLAASIEENGILQPIIARQQPEGYEIIAGERRWRAANLLDLEEVPVIVKEIADEKMLELALIENVQREDLNPIETAKAYKELTESLNLTQDEVARRVGKNRATITNLIRLLNLPEDVIEKVSRGTLSMGHARALLSLEVEDDMIALAEKVEREKLSVRALEKLVKRLLDPPPPKEVPEKPAYLLDLEDRLRKTLGTKVKIRENGGRGSITIDFYSVEEFERIRDILEA